VRAVCWILGLAACAAAQDFSDLRLERVATGYTFTEGPAWSRDGYLIFSDVPADKLLQFTPGEAATIYRGNANGANGNTFDAQGRLYTCESHSRRVTRTDKKGKIDVLADRWQGRRLNAPNDIVVRKDGNIYFTDPAFGNQQDTAELDFQGVFRISRRGDLELVARSKSRPNGIAISPDGRILYVADSDERKVRAWDLDRSGAASGERVVIGGVDGVPDGLRVDEKGNLYVVASRVEVYSSDGKYLGTVRTPEPPSNCAFGDPDFETLYITAKTSIYRVRLNVKGSVQY